MTLGEAIARGLPLVVDVGSGNRRYAAELWITRTGIAFADVGWDQLAHAGHPFHLVEGPVSPDGPPWRVGDAAIDLIVQGEPLYAEVAAWSGHRAGKTAAAERETALASLQRDLGPIEVIEEPTPA